MSTEENRKDEEKKDIEKIENAPEEMKESLYIRGREIEWLGRLLNENKDAWMHHLADALHDYEGLDELPASIGSFIEGNENLIMALLLEDLFSRKVAMKEKPKSSIYKYVEFFKKNAEKFLNLRMGGVITFSPSEVDTKFEDGRDHVTTVGFYLKKVFLMADAPLDVRPTRISWLNGQEKGYITVGWNPEPRYGQSHAKRISEEDKVRMRTWMDEVFPGMRLEKMNEKAWKVYSSPKEDWIEEEGELMTWQEARNYMRELESIENKQGKEYFELKEYKVERPDLIEYKKGLGLF